MKDLTEIAESNPVSFDLDGFMFAWERVPLRYILGDERWRPSQPIIPRSADPNEGDTIVVIKEHDPDYRLLLGYWAAHSAWKSREKAVPAYVGRRTVKSVSEQNEFVFPGVEKVLVLRGGKPHIADATEMDLVRLNNLERSRRPAHLWPNEGVIRREGPSTFRMWSEGGPWGPQWSAWSGHKNLTVEKAKQLLPNYKT
jgi:hypothetical protein